MKKKFCLGLLLTVILCLTACAYDSEKLEEKNRREHEETCARVMNEMEIRLSEKYADILGNNPDLDIVCELANELDKFGCNNRVSVDGRDIGEGAMGIDGKSSDEIREFFEK